MLCRYLHDSGRVLLGLATRLGITWVLLIVVLNISVCLFAQLAEGRYQERREKEVSSTFKEVSFMTLCNVLACIGKGHQKNI